MSGEDERQARLSQERHRRTLTQQRRRAKRWLRYNVVARTLCVTAATVGILVLASMSAWYEGRGGGYVAAGAVAAAFAMGAAIAHWRVENRNENVDNLESRILDLEDPTLDIRLRALDEEREDLERRLLDQTLLRNFLTGLVVVDVVAVVSLPFWYGGPGYWGLLAGSLILLAFLQITRDRARELEADRRQTEYEAAVMRSEPEQKPETLFLK